MNIMRGIEGLRGKEPVGAVLTIGTKGERGNPIDRDRFYIKVPDAADNVRANHPAFAFYNTAKPEHRRSIRGVLVHAQEAQCFEWHRQAYRLPKPFRNHDKLPACKGDGRKAQRLVVLDDRPPEFLEIDCQNELCQYAMQPNPATPAACKPWARLLFQPIWKKETMPAPLAQGEVQTLPTPLIKLTTGSWHSISAIVGFFEYVRGQAALCGVRSPSLWGVQFELTLSEKTSGTKRFPVLRMAPTQQLQELLIAQAQRLGQLAEHPQYVGLLDAPEQEAEVISADHAGVTVGCPREG